MVGNYYCMEERKTWGGARQLGTPPSSLISMSRNTLAAFALCAVWGGASERGRALASFTDDDTLVNQVPMIMAHDAGSGYLGRGLVNRWTKTQSQGMKEQLECGARVFDAVSMGAGGSGVWRPMRSEGDISDPPSLTHSAPSLTARRGWCGTMGTL